MPFLPTNNFLTDDEKKKQQEQSSNFISNDSSNTFTLGLPNGNNPSNRNQPKQSGSFVNLNKYLDANKEQASQMGSDIAGRVESKATTAQQNVNSLASEKYNVGQVDTNKYLQDPVKNSDDDIKEYQALRSTGGYAGPDDISGTKNYQNAQKSVDEASGLVKNAGTEEGRIALLQDQYKRPSYTRGSQVLDQTLVQNNEDSKQKFNDVTNRFSNLNSLLDGTVRDVGNSINESKKQALTNKQLINSAEANSWNDLVNPIKARADEYNANNSALISRVNADVSDEILSEETLKLLGLSEGQKLYDMNLVNYLNSDTTQAGLDNVASAEERAKYLALQKLINDPTRTEITANGKAINPVGFDKARFDADNAAKLAELNRLFANKTISAEGGFEYEGDQAKGYAGLNVADYLARGDAAVSTYDPRNPFIPTSTAQEAIQLAKNEALRQLEEYLNQQKYYRAIKKG